MVSNVMTNNDAILWRAMISFYGIITHYNVIISLSDIITYHNVIKWFYNELEHIALCPVVTLRFNFQF